MPLAMLSVFFIEPRINELFGLLSINKFLISLNFGGLKSLPVRGGYSNSSKNLSLAT